VRCPLRLSDSLWDGRDDGDTSERIKSSAELRLRCEVMAVPVTPRRDEEVKIIENKEEWKGVEEDICALNTPDRGTENAETPGQSSPDTAGSCRHAPPSIEEGEVDQSDAVKPEVPLKASQSATPSGSTKKNRKMKNLVKPAQSPVLCEQQADAPAAEGSGLGLLQPPQVEIQTDGLLHIVLMR